MSTASPTPGQAQQQVLEAIAGDTVMYVRNVFRAFLDSEPQAEVIENCANLILAGQLKPMEFFKNVAAPEEHRNASIPPTPGQAQQQLLEAIAGDTVMYVRNVFRVFLGAEPQAAVIEKCANLILAGQLNPMEFFKNVATSEEHRNASIRLKYKSPVLESMANHDFVGEPRFVAAMNDAVGDFERLHGTHPDWNFHVLLWVAAQAMKLPGDLVQCGVFNGTDGAAIVHYTNFGARTDKRFFLLDTFVGVPEDQWTPSELARHADSAQWLYKEVGDRYASVVERFRPYPNVRVIRGAVPDTLDEVDSTAIATLFLDMNCAAPEVAAMEYFWDRIVPGGMIFSDDYGHSLGGLYHYEQKVAFDTFAASHGLEVLSLPTGQGLLVKA